MYAMKIFRLMWLSSTSSIRGAWLSASVGSCPAGGSGFGGNEKLGVVLGSIVGGLLTGRGGMGRGSSSSTQRL